MKIYNHVNTKLKSTSSAAGRGLLKTCCVTISAFNAGTEQTDLVALDKYVTWYAGNKAIFNYAAKHTGNTLETYIDDELALSITMCEVHELINNEPNY